MQHISYLLLVLTTFFSISLYASDIYELKSFLNPQHCLDYNNMPNSAVLQSFGFYVNNRNDYSVLYLDTSSLDLNLEGWSIRVRKRADQGSHRIQYKKRYPVANDDLYAVKQQASEDGFDLQDADWRIETDWGFNQQTFSVSVTEKHKFKGISDALGMPKLTNLRKAVMSSAPINFSNWQQDDWGAQKLNTAKSFGTVFFTRFEGGYLFYNNQEIKDIVLEVWHLRGEQAHQQEIVVEMSFRAIGYGEAQTKREILNTFLAEQGWLLTKDILKTQIILERYK